MIGLGQGACPFGKAARLARIDPCERQIMCCQTNFKQPVVNAVRRGIVSPDQFLARLTLEHDQGRLRLSHPTDKFSQACLVVGKLFVLTF